MANNVIFWDGKKEVALPNKISVDTNIALAVSIQGHEYNACANLFVKHCIENDITLYFPGIHYIELQHQLELAITKQVGHRQYKLKYGNEYQVPGGYKKYSADLEAAGADLSVLVTPRVETALQTFTELTQFISTTIDMDTLRDIARLRRVVPYDVETNDLVGIITAHNYGINSYVTNDGGMMNVNNINVIKLIPNMKINQKQPDIIPFSNGCIYIK